ncbi:hypothetical protein TraAM80_08528, partial [Trypanosoma rangeli]
MTEAEIEGQYCGRKPEFVQWLRASVQSSGGQTHGSGETTPGGAGRDSTVENGSQEEKRDQRCQESNGGRQNPQESDLPQEQSRVSVEPARHADRSEGGGGGIAVETVGRREDERSEEDKTSAPTEGDVKDK